MKKKEKKQKKIKKGKVSKKKKKKRKVLWITVVIHSAFGYGGTVISLHPLVIYIYIYIYIYKTKTLYTFVIHSFIATSYYSFTSFY